MATQLLKSMARKYIQTVKIRFEGSHSITKFLRNSQSKTQFRNYTGAKMLPAQVSPFSMKLHVQRVLPFFDTIAKKY